MRQWMSVLGIAAACVAISLPAAAEVQNIRIDGEITVRGFMRDNYGTTGSGGGIGFSGTPFANTSSRSWYNTTALIGVSADLTENVMARVRLGNERDWGVVTTGTETTVDMYDAFLTFNEFLLPEFNLKIGRMPVFIADGLLIGDGVTDETLLGSDYAAKKQFDGIVSMLDYDYFVFKFGTLKIIESPSTVQNDTDIYFANVQYKFGPEGASTWDTSIVNVHYRSPGALPTGPNGLSTQSVDVIALATSLQVNLGGGLSANVGGAHQGGRYEKTATNARNLRAWALDGGLQFAPDVILTPKAGIKYVYRSGDKGLGQRRYNGWLPLFEDQTNGVIYDPNTNISAFAINGSLMPTDKLTLAAEVWAYSLAKKMPANPAVGTTNKRNAGAELDLGILYDYTEDVALGFNLAWFFPGNYYGRGATGAKFDRVAMQAMLELGLRF